jgi:hypothetical protein
MTHHFCSFLRVKFCGAVQSLSTIYVGGAATGKESLARASSGQKVSKGSAY